MLQNLREKIRLAVELTIGLVLVLDGIRVGNFATSAVGMYFLLNADAQLCVNKGTAAK